MSHVTLRLAVPLSCLAAASGCSDAGGPDRAERPALDTGVAVALVLRPERQVIKEGWRPQLTGTLVNRGARAVVLVAPGDGSDCGWRTPVVEWSLQPPELERSLRPRHERSRKCGNINARARRLERVGLA